MVDTKVIEHDRVDATDQTCAKDRVALVEVRLDRTSGLEVLHGSAKPLWKEERANNRERDVWSHPKLSTSTTLASSIAGWEVEDDLANPVDEDRGEACANKPTKLVVVCVSDQWHARDQDNRQCEERQHERDVVERKQGEEEAGQTWEELHVLDVITIQAELELERCVDCANSLFSGQLDDQDGEYNARLTHRVRCFK